MYGDGPAPLSPSEEEKLEAIATKLQLDCLGDRAGRRYLGEYNRLCRQIAWRRVKARLRRLPKRLRNVLGLIAYSFAWFGAGMSGASIPPRERKELHT